ncbi:unnamed protein product [Rhizophagus irregularis]|nr:unnamed protein product [Rhizophagus irregularis]
MIQNRKNKNTEKGLASDNRNKTITNINKSSFNIQQAVEGTATPIHERAQTTNINKSSSNIQQAVEGTATPIHERTQTTNINKNSSNTQQPSAAPSHERAQSVKERYKNLWLPDSSNTQPLSAAPKNRRLSQEVSYLCAKYLHLDVIDVPEERLAKRFKSDGSKKVKKTVHYAKNQPKEEQEEQREKEARIEMKMILKTIKPNDNLDDNETFNSPKNVEIHSRLIPELRRAMFPNYKPSVAQLTNWLSAFHKSQRSQTQLKKSGKSDENSRRVYNNSRVQNVAKDLYRKSDERIIGYEKRQLLKMLANRSYHLPEISDSTLQPNAPEDAPQWSYVEQEDFIYDTEIDSRSSFDEDEDYGEEMEEVLIDSQKSAAGDDLAE